MKTKLSIAALLILAAAQAAEPAKQNEPCSCCKPPTEASTFTRDSLYQLDAKFTNDAGVSLALGKFQGRPVVLTMFFASCGYACPLLVADIQRIQEKLPADVRKRAAFVLVSFDDVRDTP